jgi:hypothetical protein
MNKLLLILNIFKKEFVGASTVEILVGGAVIVRLDRFS